MALEDVVAPDATAPGGALDVEIVVPVHNEELDLARSILRLRAYLDDRFPFATVVTIADNASTDRTPAIAERLAAELGGVQVARLAEKGRGRALRAAWLASRASVVAYMDVDLSTDLDALLPLVAPLLSGHSDLAIGTRLAPASNVVRGPKREVISRSYNLLVRGLLGTRFSDAQCGFKALTRPAAQALVPLVEDNEWFFDTEILVLAQRNGLRIAEVPVDWVDDPDSTVDLSSTARADLAGIARLLSSFAAGRGRIASGSLGARRDQGAAELTRVASVGVASTLAYLALFVLWRPVAGAYLASAVALVVLTIANTGVHAWLSSDALHYLDDRERLAGLGLATLATLATTTAALAVAGALVGTSAGVQLAAVLVGTALAVPLRFLAVHTLTFQARARRSAERDPARLADRRLRRS